MQYQRRPGIDRIFAVVAVAVALLGLAGEDVLAARAARAERTVAELGAGQVLTVRAAGQTALLSAVRQADPGGRAAMAVAVDDTASPPVLAVDADRLAAVAGQSRALAAGLARADAAVRGDRAAPDQPPPVDGTALTASVRNDSGVPVWLVVQLAHAGTGAAVAVTVGPFDPGEHEASAPVRGCTGDPGCRLAGLTLAGAPGPDGRPQDPPARAAVAVRGLRQDGPAKTVLDAGTLGDPRLWRAATTGLGLILGPRKGVLSLAVPPVAEGQSARPDTRAYLVGTPLPLAALIAGDPPRGWSSAEPALTLFGARAVPLRPEPTGELLPALGRTGIVLDLDTVARALPDAVMPGTLQVWLARDVSPEAAADLVRRLAAAGVEVVGTETADAHEARLAEQGPAFAVRFRLLSALAGLLLAAVAAAVAVGVERRVRAAELRAMRAQGVPARVGPAAAAGGQGALLGLGALAGLLVAGGIAGLSGAPVAAFTDDWQLTEPPPALQPGALAVIALLSLVVLAAASAGALRGTGKEPAR
ncbi:hypothetical protein AB0M46_51200 [Dactylosporangium sp. NPDC051485]|uniref:hypothetical protein n=1 Tax=Dactylosporangium sp. NPDC051485 TaxID=3154846 RepID=UPI0034128A2E